MSQPSRADLPGRPADRRLLPPAVVDPAGQSARLRRIIHTALSRRETFVCGIVLLVWSRTFTRWFEAATSERDDAEAISPFTYTMY